MVDEIQRQLKALVIRVIGADPA